MVSEIFLCLLLRVFIWTGILNKSKRLQFCRFSFSLRLFFFIFVYFSEFVLNFAIWYGAGHCWLLSLSSYKHRIQLIRKLFFSWFFFDESHQEYFCALCHASLFELKSSLNPTVCNSIYFHLFILNFFYYNFEFILNFLIWQSAFSLPNITKEYI